MSVGASSGEELGRLLGISRAFVFSRAFNMSAKLDLYSHLAKHPQGLAWQAIAESLGLQRSPDFRGVRDFLDLLVTLRTLQREGEGPGALYRNAECANRFLVSSSEESICGILALNYDRSYLSMEHLESALRTGAAPDDPRIPDILSVFGDRGAEAAAEHFSSGMQGASIGNFRRLAATFDWSRFRSLCDMGGSNGCLCTCVCTAQPHISAVTCDLPPVRKTAEAYVHAKGLDGRVKVVDHDFFSDEPFPTGHDVITMGMILHDWGLTRKMQLIHKAFQALPEGGCLIAVDNLIDDARREGTVQLGMSLVMLVEFGRENAFDYSFKEFCQWTAEVGFARCERMHLAGTTVAAIAYKEQQQ